MSPQFAPRSDETDPLIQAQAVYQKLRTVQQSLILATVNADGSPLASYTPFVADEQQQQALCTPPENRRLSLSKSVSTSSVCVTPGQQFYIFVSTLSAHTQNLTRTGQASLMLVEDELQASQIFARQRVTLACQVESLARQTDAWARAASLYEARFGNIFTLIKGFADFTMFRLRPERGSLVVGFGQAYEMSGDSLVVSQADIDG